MLYETRVPLSECVKSWNIDRVRCLWLHLWALLSSDKFRNFTEYRGNKLSHHFAFKVRENFSSSLYKVELVLLKMGNEIEKKRGHWQTICSSYFYSHSVLPHHVKTEVPVCRTTNVTRLNVFVKRNSLENFVTKVVEINVNCELHFGRSTQRLRFKRFTIMGEVTSQIPNKVLRIGDPKQINVLTYLYTSEKA